MTWFTALCHALLHKQGLRSPGRCAAATRRIQGSAARKEHAGTLFILLCAASSSSGGGRMPRVLRIALRLSRSVDDFLQQFRPGHAGRGAPLHPACRTAATAVRSCGRTWRYSPARARRPRARPRRPARRRCPDGIAAPGRRRRQRRRCRRPPPPRFAWLLRHGVRGVALGEFQHLPQHVAHMRRGRRVLAGLLVQEAPSPPRLPARPSHLRAARSGCERRWSVLPSPAPRTGWCRRRCAAAGVRRRAWAIAPRT